MCNLYYMSGFTKLYQTSPRVRLCRHFTVQILDSNRGMAWVTVEINNCICFIKIKPVAQNPDLLVQLNTI